MKLKKLLLGMVAGCGLFILPLIVSACNFDWLNTDKCTNNDYPYYYSSSKKCCSYPYYSNGLCYQSYSDCLATGYYCEICNIED